ncbi:contractile injection system tape measure protein [Roseateles chitinivorans]|uniref:contractile injection system tape measure protein n=1 Tax=Roseateles chitinivorans TaxID=2917965 RepID=UPI003D67714F
MRESDHASSHLVERMTVDADFGAGLGLGVTPGEAETRLVACVQGPLLRVIDEVFDACCPPEEHWRLDELEIDLGELAAADWETEAPRLLRERLRRVLEELRGPGATSASGRATGLRVSTRPQARRDALLHFLRHGRLPWQGRGDDPAGLAREALREDAGALVAALRAAPGRAALLQRMAAQFDEDLLGTLVHAFMPGEPAAAARLLDIVAQARRDGRSPRTRAALWESVLGQAMDHAVAPRPATLMLLRAQLLAALDAGAAFSSGSDPLNTVAHAWAPLLREDRDWLRATLQRVGETATARERLVQALPEPLLPRLLSLWMTEPAAQAVAAWIAAAAAGQVPGDRPGGAAPGMPPASTAGRGAPSHRPGPSTTDGATVEARRRRLWQATLGHAVRHPSTGFDPARYESDVREDLERHTPAGAEPPARWYDRAVRAATSVLAAALNVLRLPWRKAPDASVPDERRTSAIAAEAPGMDPSAEQIAVGNAGLVLVSPYLPRLFSMLGLADTRAFIGPEAASRAALLLQALATGHAAAPEPELALNKLLCGLPLDAPLPRLIDLSEAEREAIDGLLVAVIQHWRILGTTSPDGLRGSFLRRDGHLERRDDAWQLSVVPGPFDMLIDQLPWGYATLRHPWMERVIHVEWR